MANIVPTWTALKACLLGARVSKVTDDGLVFQASAGGTSGAAEPTWPTTSPWTVVDGTVTWMLASSFRQQVVTGVVAVLTAFQAANPTLLVQTSSARPRSATNFALPGAYIDTRSESVTFDHDIRYTTLTTPVIVCVQVSDNVQAEAQMDAIMDGLRDAFTLAFHAAAGGVSITAQGVANDTNSPELGMPYLANVIAIASTVNEGRT